MERKHIPVTRETVVDNNPSLRLGPVTLMLPEGDALVTDAVSLTMLTISHDDHGKLIAIVAASDHHGGRLGAIAPLTPDGARAFALSLIKAADAIDMGRDQPDGRVN